jgi:hypothetical protein
VLYDLHSHTTASDGRLSPAELVQEAARSKVDVLAITDHDTVAGIDEAIEEASSRGLELIPGIEVSATAGDASVHVLGLFIQHREPWLVEFFAEAQKRRVARVHRIVQKLAGLGVRIEPDEVFARSTHGSVGRPHVAQVLVDRGVVRDFAEAFDRYLGHRAPAYVGYDKITCRDATEIIRRAGGVSSLAHPALLEQDQLIPAMVQDGLQAIEVYHSEHSPEDASRYQALAHRHGLVITGGSDFHAIDGSGKLTLGCRELSEKDFARLRRAVS